MTDNPKVPIPDLKPELLKVGWVLLTASECLAQVIAIARSGKPITDELLADLKSRMLIYAKNRPIFGLSIDTEAQVGGQAFAQFDDLFEAAIKRSRQIHD